MQKEVKGVIYPNYHIPPEHRSLLLKPLDAILTNQGNTNLKRIAFLYFSQLFENVPQAFKDDGIVIDENRLIISPVKLSQRSTQGSPSRYADIVENLQNVIIESKLNRSNKLQKQAASELSVINEKEVSNSVYQHINQNYFNLIELTPVEQKKLTGKTEDNFKKQVVMMIESVKMNNDFTIEVVLSNFMKQVRDHLKKQISNNASTPFSDPEIIPVNTNEIKHFKSGYAIQLYLKIAKEQFYSNKLIISVEELAGYLGWTQNNKAYSTKVFLKYLRETIIKDPGLTKSTCALIPIPTKKETKNKQYWVPAKRDRMKVTHIELRFKNNDELQQMLLDQPYGFIRHLSSSQLNKAILIQIIKRVHDEIIEMNYVNYCVNKAYQYIERDIKRAKDYEKQGIGPLVWDYIKAGTYRDEYSNKEEMWDVSQPVGISITKYQKEHQPELGFKVSEKKKAASVNESSFWTYIDGLFSADDSSFPDYAKKHISFDQLSKRLEIEGDAAKSVKAYVLSDFKTSNKKKLVSYINDLGFDSKKSEMLFRIMNDESLTTMFSFFVDGRLEIPQTKEWRALFTKDFHEQLNSAF